MDDAAGLKEPWRLHDLRRTAATRMADLGVAPHVIEAALKSHQRTQGWRRRHLQSQHVRCREARRVGPVGQSPDDGGGEGGGSERHATYPEKLADPHRLIN